MSNSINNVNSVATALYETGRFTASKGGSLLGRALLYTGVALNGIGLGVSTISAAVGGGIGFLASLPTGNRELVGYGAIFGGAIGALPFLPVRGALATISYLGARIHSYADKPEDSNDDIFDDDSSLIRASLNDITFIAGLVIAPAIYQVQENDLPPDED